MSHCYLGIDNGLTGGLVALPSYPAGSLLAQLPMPTLAARKGREIDLAAIWQWIDQLGDRTRLTVAIEEPGGSRNARACASMAGSFHALRALCVLKKLRWHRLTPQSWQKVLLPGCAPGDTKPRALAAARQLWPTETFLATPRSTKPHEGLLDAALIAEHARRLGW